MLSSFFMNPWMLAAVAAVTLPPIIEWLFRRRKRQLELPTLRYLLRTKEEEKIKRQDRILLILRMVGIFLIVLAASRPLIQHGQFMEQRQRHVVVLIDKTSSMNQQVGVTSSFGLAQKKAAGMVRGLPEGTVVSVAQIGDRAEVVLEGETDLHTTADRIGQLRSGSGAAPMHEAIEAVSAYLEKTEVPGKPEVYIFSDFQKYTWMRKGAATQTTTTALNALTSKHETFLVDVGGELEFNYIVSGLRPKEFLMSAGKPVEFIATVEATGRPPEDAKATMSFLVNGEKKHAREIPASQEPQRIVFDHHFASPGEYLVEVIMEGDEHLVDNRRLYLCTVPEDIRVLVLDETAGTPMPESLYLSRAIAPPHDPGMEKVSRYSTKVVHPRQITFENLEEYKVVALLGTESLTAPSVAKLERYVEDGGAIWFFLNDKLNRYIYNKELFKEGKGLLPAKLKEPVQAKVDNGKKIHLVPGLSEHSIMQVLSQHGGSPEGKVLQYYGLEPPPEEGSEVDVVAKLTNEVPAMLEKRLGRGRVMLTSTTAGSDWTYLPATFEFPILVHETLRYLVGNPDAGVVLEVGDRFSSPVFITQQQLVLRLPDGNKSPRITPKKRKDRENQWIMHFTGTNQQGLYEFLDVPPGVLPRTKFVVNARSEEGELARLDSGGFADVFGSGDWGWIGPEKPIEDFVASLHTVTELAAWVLWGLAAILAAESFLAARYGRRRGEGSETT